MVESKEQYHEAMIMATTNVPVAYGLSIDQIKEPGEFCHCESNVQMTEKITKF
ncbi:MAG: hypothetical protein NPIRA03_39020 [Nitrospirales bacterium]|nr:MAG: hypothetical protein NPIRA03_39020 [Nitrospirales bacterium]